MEKVIQLGSLLFTWSGGPYIDIHTLNQDGLFEISDQNINVWDYETGKARVPFTDKSFHRKVTEWVTERQRS